MSRHRLQALVHSGENIRELQRTQRLLNAELRPRGVRGEIFFDREWCSYLRGILISPTAANIFEPENQTSRPADQVPILRKANYARWFFSDKPPGHCAALRYIAYAGSQALLLNDYTSSTPSPCVLNYNVYYAISGSLNSTFVWQHVTHTTYATYLSASAQDSKSSFADPKLVNLTTPDLHVLSSSPAVNKGINLGSSIVGRADYAGSPRVQGTNIDIGAYEQ